MTTRWMDSPIGGLRLHSDGESITAIDFDAEARGNEVEDPLLEQAEQQLCEYFDGTRTDFELPVAGGGTEFQRRVWAELVKIPYGETASYGEVARRLGMVTGASRAVGLANGSNPIPIVVPCHRVIGANGTLTGYAGGLDKKRILLTLEGVLKEDPALF